MTTTNNPTVTVERCRTLRGVPEPNEWDILVDGEWVGTMGRRTGIYNTNYDVRLDGSSAVYLPSGTTCWGAKALAKAMALAGAELLAAKIPLDYIEVDLRDNQQGG